MDPLQELAVRLMNCRKRGNRLTLECILESARFLGEAKEIAKKGFSRWLIEQGHMDISTANRHLRVARFIRKHGALMPQIATLGIAKIYALSALDSGAAARILSGHIKFSAPIEELSDLEFRHEFKEKFPAERRTHTRLQVYQSTASALTRAVNAMQHAASFIRKMTPAQRHKIVNRIQALVKLIAGWNQVA
jgi:hypothetical protein